MVNKKIELLSPAGNLASFKAACIGGADAIYMGLSKFNARQMAENFDVEKYIECIEYAHYRGIKVYLTLNTLLYDSEIKEAIDLVIKLYSRGLDAVIIQDIGLAYILHKILPDLHLHASTQMSVYSKSQVKFLESIGFSRVVLARELTIQEIKEICESTNMETEVFIHGALCVSMSGQCLLSSVIGSRSANRGACAQPCRMKYSLFDTNNKEVIKEKYLLSKKDIYGLEYVNELKNIGVTSLKIEGRNKSFEYVLGVTKTYRKYIDKKMDVLENDKYILKQLFNRDGLSDGYLKKVRYKESISLLTPKNKGIYIGEVIKKYKKYVKVKLAEDISMHDGIEIYSEGKVISNIITCIKDENGNILNSDVKKGNYVYIGDFNENIKEKSSVYRTSSSKLNKMLAQEFNTGNKTKNLSLQIIIKSNKKISLEVKEKNINYEYDYVPEIAKTKEITKEDVIKAFSKTKDEPYLFSNIEVILDKNLFIPISVLNSIRRDLTQKIKDSEKILLDTCEFINKEKDVIKDLDNKISKLNNCNKKENTYFVYKFSNNIDYIKEFKNKFNLSLDILYINIADFLKFKNEIINKYKGKVKLFLYIHNFVGKNLDNIITKNIEGYLSEGISGVLLGSFAYFDMLIKLKEKYNFLLYADYSFNVTNLYSAYFLTMLGFDKITPSVELSGTEYDNFSKYFNIECVNDIITVMTSRYCILGSFIGREGEEESCKRPCKNMYYLKDLHRC